MPYPPYPQSVPLASLTPRERQVIPYIAEGRANKVIAIELGISQRTAEAHRARIFQKLGVRNAVELVRAMWHVPDGGCRLAEPSPVPYGKNCGGAAAALARAASASPIAEPVAAVRRAASARAASARPTPVTPAPSRATPSRATPARADPASAAPAASVPPGAHHVTGRRRLVRGPLHQWDPDQADVSDGKQD
jgi:DNA-binding CsgD family transcriptional regulator